MSSALKSIGPIAVAKLAIMIVFAIIAIILIPSGISVLLNGSIVSGILTLLAGLMCAGVAYLLHKN